MFANKELNQITNILNEFFTPFDCIAEPGTDFSYDSSSNTITYALLVNDEHAESFIHFAESLNPVHADIFLWSVLHELGHNQTEDDFDEEDEVNYWRIASNAKNDEEYYNIPEEYAATDWAGKFMIENEAEVAELWNNLAPAIKAFYDAMEVE